MKNVKVVLFCESSQGFEDLLWGDRGCLRADYQRLSGVEVEARGFGGNLVDTNGKPNENGKAFLEACKTADVLVTDAWTGTSMYTNTEEPLARMAEMVWRAKKLNPRLVVFGDLLEGEHETILHQMYGATPIRHWRDKKIIEAVKKAALT